MKKEQWLRPDMEEFDIAERTQSGDGFNFDGRDPSFEDGDDAAAGGGTEPSS